MLVKEIFTVNWILLKNLIERVFVQHLILGVLFIGLSASSCSVRQIVVGEVADMVEDGGAAFENDDDLIMIENALPANIKLLEVLSQNDKSNTKILWLIARMYGSYAFSVFEPQLVQARYNKHTKATKLITQRLKRYYSKGLSYASQALFQKYPACKNELAKVTKINSCLARLNKDDVPILFWYGFNLASYVNLSLDSVKAISKAFSIQKIMNRVIELDENYYHGGAHLILMIYYTSRPALLGGKPQKALSHYRRLKNLTGTSYLLGDLYFARHYLVQKQEKGQFIKKMKYIIGAKNSQYILFNQIAKNYASLYLRMVNRFFVE